MGALGAKPRVGDRLRVHIDRLSVGGRGVARSGALVIFVADVAPNEDVDVEISLVKKNYAEARLLEVVKPSTARVRPPCPVAGVCGGCNWQHIDYPEQLVQKRQLVRESLRKFSGFDISDDSLVQPLIASPNPLRYRNRVQFHHAGTDVGYYRRASHRLVSIDDCPITELPIAQKIPELKARLAGQPPGRIEVYISEDGLVRTRGPESTPDSVEDRDDQEGGLNFAFSQVNTQQNRNLISSVVSVFVSKVNPEDGSPSILDLYAGSGNFTFPLAKAFPSAEITAVELNRESVVRGEALARENDQKIRWVQSDVEAFLKTNLISKGTGVLIDPPRAGCSPEVAKMLADSPLRFLVYVSCHPVTLARDLKTFATAGFHLETVQPFDMFPQTDHVETLVVLTRSTSV